MTAINGFRVQDPSISLSIVYPAIFVSLECRIVAATNHDVLAEEEDPVSIQANRQRGQQVGTAAIGRIQLSVGRSYGRIQISSHDECNLACDNSIVKLYKFVYRNFPPFSITITYRLISSLFICDNSLRI